MAQDYTIKYGDTLSGIGNQFGLDYNQIAKWNNIANPNQIYAGSILKLYDPNTAGQPAAPSAPSTPAVETRKSFDEVLPFDTVFNPNLVTGLAESQINPEVERQAFVGNRDLDNQLAQTGGYRTGYGQYQQQAKKDQFERGRKEQVGGFVSNIKNYLTDWYNQQYENYNKNPGTFVMPKVPTAQEYMQGNPNIMNMYNQQTSVPTTYQNPFKF